MSRADGKGDIFLNDVDRQDFLTTLAEACQKTGFQVQACCLMRNHFHLVVETPNANLVAGMRWLLSTCTIRQIARRLHMGNCHACSLRVFLQPRSRLAGAAFIGMSPRREGFD